MLLPAAKPQVNKLLTLSSHSPPVKVKIPLGGAAVGLENKPV